MNCCLTIDRALQRERRIRINLQIAAERPIAKRGARTIGPALNLDNADGVSRERTAVERSAVAQKYYAAIHGLYRAGTNDLHIVKVDVCGGIRLNPAAAVDRNRAGKAK